MLPQEPVMLFSFLNMKLRDQYGSLMELCDDLDVDEEELLVKMGRAGFYYDREDNCFKQK